MAKKKWEKPKLIVLVREKSEEGVLLYCKQSFPVTAGPYLLQNSCQDRTSPPMMFCFNCQDHKIGS